MKFAAVGFTCIDLYKNLNFGYPTGNGVDMMFNLAEMVSPLELSLVTAVGGDEYGKQMLAVCRRRNVDCTHVSIVPEGNTAVIEMLLNGRDRVHHHAEKGVMISYQPTGKDMDFIRTQDFIHTDMSWRVADPLPEMRRGGTQVYFDFSKNYQHPDVERILKHVDYGIFSFEEETEEAREVLQMGCRLGAKVLLATFGENGSLAFDGTEFFRQGCVPASKLVNTVGAGDAYGAGFMSGILRGLALPECMSLGAKKSAEIVSIFEPYHMRQGETTYEGSE